MTTIYTVIVQDSAGDIHEIWAFDNDQESLKCEQYLSSLPYYSGTEKNEFTVVYGIHELNQNYIREVEVA